MTALKLIGLAAATLFIVTPAFAEDLCTGVTERKTVDEAKAVAIAAGYADITKMDEEHGCYEAKGLNADGSKFEVYIHPTSLEIVKVKKEG
ncbi:PepSY domain-containing protein [Aestuariivirga sp.]|uniref:PepSY domain-containing protein n=1 Tax=Aestuariivirga sp. TaxID=2650926 RepID=UPI003593F630